MAAAARPHPMLRVTDMCELLRGYAIEERASPIGSPSMRARIHWKAVVHFELIGRRGKVVLGPLIDGRISEDRFNGDSDPRCARKVVSSRFPLGLAQEQLSMRSCVVLPVKKCITNCQERRSACNTPERCPSMPGWSASSLPRCHLEKPAIRGCGSLAPFNRHLAKLSRFHRSEGQHIQLGIMGHALPDYLGSAEHPQGGPESTSKSDRLKLVDPGVLNPTQLASRVDRVRKL